MRISLRGKTDWNPFDIGLKDNPNPPEPRNFSGSMCEECGIGELADPSISTHIIALYPRIEKNYCETCAKQLGLVQQCAWCIFEAHTDQELFSDSGLCPECQRIIETLQLEAV